MIAASVSLVLALGHSHTRHHTSRRQEAREQYCGIWRETSTLVQARLGRVRVAPVVQSEQVTGNRARSIRLYCAVPHRGRRHLALASPALFL